jgi:hypothetical protein
MRFVIPICCAAVAVPGWAFAQPSISDLSSTNLTAGDTYSISGSDFGTKDPVEPLSFDDFEDGSLGEILGTAKVGRGWSHQASVDNGLCNGDPCTHYSDEIVHGGLQSAKVEVDQYGFNFFGWTSSDNFREIYVRYWRYFSPYVADLSNICNHKQIYIYNSHGDDPQWLLGAVQSPGEPWPINTQGACTTTFTDLAGIDRRTNVSYPGASFVPGEVSQWKSWELYLRNDSPASAENGAEYLWVDGKLLQGNIEYSRPDYSSPNLELTDREHVNLISNDCPVQDITMQDVRMGAMVHNDDPCSSRDTPGQPDVTYLDDVYIDQTRARIEICDAATRSAKEQMGAVCEIQVPRVEWSSTAIQFQAHQGSFASGQSLYLYVVDASGAANEDGFAVTFGGSEPPPDGGTGAGGVGGSAGVDAGTGGDPPSAAPASDDDGCSCRAAPVFSSSGAKALAIGLLMVLRRRRRRSLA